MQLYSVPKSENACCFSMLYLQTGFCLEQRFTAYILLLVAAGTFGLGRRCCNHITDVWLTFYPFPPVDIIWAMMFEVECLALGLFCVFSLAFLTCVSLGSLYIFVFVFCSVEFCFLHTSQEIGWKECLGNDPFLWWAEHKLLIHSVRASFVY